MLNLSLFMKISTHWTQVNNHDPVKSGERFGQGLQPRPKRLKTSIAFKR